MMNTNKFLLGGLVATIAIVSVQITNQLQIQELIEKVETIPQQAAVVTALDTKTITPPLLIENTCLKSTITQSFGTNMKQAVDQKISLTATCDKTTVNELILGFSSLSKESLNNLQIKNITTGKVHPVEIKGITENTSDVGQKFFGTVSKVTINSPLAKNTTHTFSLVSTTYDVQIYIPATGVTVNGTKSLVSYSDYNNGPASIPRWILNWWCDNVGGTWTANGGTYACDTNAHF